MPDLPSISDCQLNRWSLSCWCTKCRMGRTFLPIDLDEMALLPPRTWTQPMDVTMGYFRCTRCGGKASMLTIDREINTEGGRQTERVLDLRRG
jgi:Zn finger protein HypA/HybF involved in hydrogenase expression